jgi:hypothetical protein
MFLLLLLSLSGKYDEFTRETGQDPAGSALSTHRSPLDGDMISMAVQEFGLKVAEKKTRLASGAVKNQLQRALPDLSLAGI